MYVVSASDPAAAKCPGKLHYGDRRHKTSGEVHRKEGSPIEEAVEGLVKTIVSTIVSVGVCHYGAEAVQLLLTVELAAKLINDRHKSVAGASITWAEPCA